MKPWMIFFAVILIIWFYWFQYRPATIRSECTKRMGDILNSKTKLSGSDIETLYNFCLHMHGLK